MAILVTGGAGYVGSHAVAALLERGEEVIVVDNLSQGHRQAVRGTKLYEIDLRNKPALRTVFEDEDVEAVIHFAAHSLVGESVEHPGKYYDNNVYGTLCLLEVMNEYEVKRIVFSSTAATYGEPERVPIIESDRTLPTNPYGQTKLAMEQMMKWFEQAYGIHYVSLRYFNVAGAHPSGNIGEDHQPETHLIPIILQIVLEQRSHISIFGDDYDTEDGTCIRDYIHVNDLADAHLLALDHLKAAKSSAIYNLGSGTGFSVKEVIDTARKVTGHPIPAKVEARRAGDPAVLIASSDRIKQELGWKPQRENLERMIADAWRWHQHHPNGYRKDEAHGQ